MCNIFTATRLNSKYEAMIQSIAGAEAINVELSRKFKKQFRCKIGQCYYNSSSKLSIIMDALNEPNILYVEGAYHDMHSHSFITTHAWLQMSGDQILEITRIDLDIPMLYYPILQFTHDQMFQQIRKLNHLPLHEHDEYSKQFYREYSLIANNFYKDRKIIDFPNDDILNN